MIRFLKKIVLVLFCLSFLSVLGGIGVLYWLIAINPGPEIELANIEKILGRESPVYYRDGSEKIGVLFQDAHRQYLPYHQIPKDFVNAIVAAEDDKFFSHIGIDFLGIARAMVANIRAGRIVQGGSTITQQTAKNLFKRESRTLKAKLKELLYALRLEYHYPKEKILEFYVNQFFVSGNGHGLGVAARYYFDKDVKELSLLENAFIAGSVKRPNYYNPFTKSSDASAEKARSRAKDRASYVLRNMKRLGFISSSEYVQAKNSGIVFKRGRMSYSLNTIMDLVRKGLASPEVAEALEENGISNVSTSGIRVFTTIDKGLEKSTLFALRRELSRLDVRMRGYDRAEVQREYSRLDYRGDRILQQGAFVFGRVTSVAWDDSGNPLVRVSFDTLRREGIITKSGLDDLLTAFARYRRQRWSEAGKDDLETLLFQLAEDDRVYVSIRELEQGGPAILNLERFPDVQGAALVLQKGALRAMVGGMENRYFNRAIDARRSMGSSFKPFLFAAALQLGWSSIDLLNNYRDVFVYQDLPYFPRPDHISHHEQVSMSWAGVNSENLAAIWLVYHLADHLTLPRLREVAAHLDLAPRSGDNPESYEHFKGRIRDKNGITVTREMLRQAAYDSAVKTLEADFLFEGRGDEYDQLRRLPYGLHFDRYAEELTEAAGTGEEVTLRRADQKELQLRLQILARNFLAVQKAMNSLEQYMLLYNKEEKPVETLDPLAFFDSQSGNIDPEGQLWETPAGQVIYSLRPGAEGWRPLTRADVRQRLASMDSQASEKFWESLLLEGYLSVYACQQVSAQMAREAEELFASQPYSMEVLSKIHDYRVLVGLQYLVHLGKETGIKSKLEPVLSFPLGSNVISLLDAVRMYETLVTGKSYTPPHVDKIDEESTGEGLAVIERIETVEGEVIYARQEYETNILDTRTAATVSNILQNTVAYGTGRYAYNHVRLTSTDPEKKDLLAKLDLPLPLLGKTGTANEFMNAAFLGYVPTILEEETVMELENGYALGVYVGFDDNRPMAQGTTHITGAVGALPTWSEMATTVVNLQEGAGRVDVADLSFNGMPLRYPPAGQVFVPVDPDQGGKVIAGRGALRTLVAPASPSILSFGRVSVLGNFEPDRFFRPYWTNAP